MHPNGRIYPLSKLHAGPGIGLRSRKVVYPFPTWLSSSLMPDAVNAVCVCQAGHIQRRQGCWWKEKEKHNMEKKRSVSNLPLLGNNLQASGDLVQRQLPIIFRRWSPEARRREAFGGCRCCSKHDGARVPEKPTAHATNSSPEVVYIVPTVATSFGSSPDRLSFPSNSKCLPFWRKERLTGIYLILTEVFPSHVKPISFLEE